MSVNYKYALGQLHDAVGPYRIIRPDPDNSHVWVDPSDHLTLHEQPYVSELAEAILRSVPDGPARARAILDADAERRLDPLDTFCTDRCPFCHGPSVYRSDDGWCVGAALHVVNYCPDCGERLPVAKP